MAEDRAEVRLEAAAAASGDDSSTESTRIVILGVPLDVMNRRQVMIRLLDHLQSPHEGLLHVVTLNPEYVMAARRDPEFRNAIARAELIVCDGIGTLLAARMIPGGSEIQRLTGVEIVKLLVRRTAFHEETGMFLLGGRDAPAAAAGLRRMMPAAQILGAWSGGTPDASCDDESIERIVGSAARIAIVGYGAPAQVLWIERNRASLEGAGVRLAVGVGGALDYFSGHASAAPERVRRLGLEWAYRLVREPWRWRRQRVLISFALLTIAHSVRVPAACRILLRRSPETRMQDPSA